MVPLPDNTYLPTYLPTYTYLNTYIHTYTHTYIHTVTYIHTCIHACMHACMHAYIHTYIHTCMHTYIHTYTHAGIPSYRRSDGQTERHNAHTCREPVMKSLGLRPVLLVSSDLDLCIRVLDQLRERGARRVKVHTLAVII